MRHYSHEPLSKDPDVHEIRLLRYVENAAQPHGLHFTLELCDLEHVQTCPEYRALSYKWDRDPNAPPTTILIDGELFDVQQNLYRFLEQYVASPIRDRCIWIDQISIDQQNILERNHQVQMMAEIYSRASEVIIWLGPCEFGSLGIFQVDDSLAIKTIVQERQHFKELFSSVERRFEQFVGGPSEQIARTNYPEEIDAINSFFGKPYWKRLWIIQEVILACHAMVWCGDHQVEWAAICEFVFLYQESVRDLLIRSSLFDLRHVFQLVQDSTTRHTSSFADCVIAYSGHKCFDSRDKIFGLQGMVPSAERLATDYAKSVVEVFIDAAIQIARHSPHRINDVWMLSLEMLGYVTSELDISRAAAALDWTSNALSCSMSATWLRYMLQHTLQNGKISCHTAFLAWSKAARDHRIPELPVDFWQSLNDLHSEYEAPSIGSQLRLVDWMNWAKSRRFAAATS